MAIQEQDFLQFISSLNGTLSSGKVNLTMVLQGNSDNFCGFNLNATPGLEFEIYFKSRGQVNLTCLSNRNLIESNTNLSLLSFEGLNLLHVSFRFNSLMSFTYKGCVLNDSDLIYTVISSNDEEMDNTTLKISDSTFLYSKVVFLGDLMIENSNLLDQEASIEPRKGSITILNSVITTIVTINQGSNINIQNSRIEGFGQIFAHDFNSLYMADSEILGASARRPKIYLCNGISILIERVHCDSNRQVLTVINVKSVKFDRFMLENSILVRECFYPNPFLLFNCDFVEIINSEFMNNIGSIYSGAVYINNYAEIILKDNNFHDNEGTKGGAVFIGYCQPDRSDNCSVTAIGNHFENNYCKESGGGMYIIYSGRAEFSRNTFIMNLAEISGGALNVDYAKEVLISNSIFEENTVLRESVHQKFNPTNDRFVQGGGGAISILGSTMVHITTSEFIENRSSKGGAILLSRSNFDQNPKSFKVEDSCSFRGNSAKVGREGYVYFETTTIPQLHFPTNTIFSTAPNTFKLIDYYPKEVYPGQAITVLLEAMDFFGKPMNFTTLMIQFAVGRDLGMTVDFIESEKKVLLTPYPLNRDFLKLSEHNITIYSEDAQYCFTILFKLLDCPEKYRIDSEDDNGVPAYLCVKSNNVDMDLVISVAVPVSIVLLIVGISIGLLSIYIVKCISVKMWILKKKEKAEMNLEMKIIDKKIIFQNPVELSQSSQTSKSKYSENSDLSIPLMENKIERPSFIIPIENVDIVRKLAEGGLGIVYLGKLWKKIDVAIKLLKSNEETDEFEKEASLLSSLRHDNILTFYGICLTADNKYMITEFAELGSLDKTLYKSRLGEIVLPLRKKLQILIATAKGIEYLHNLNPTVVHRDLKPGNILLDTKNVAKICDFGLSRTVSNSNMHSVMTTNLGTLFYCPSEVLEGPSETNMASRQTATKIDVYSFAIIMWEVFFEVIPYSSSIKFSRISPEEEKIWHNVSMFNIPGLVVKGLRPIIPFNTENEIKEWILEFMPEERNNSNICEIVRKYFEIVKRNWDHNALNRSSISDIRMALEELLTFLDA